jgi:iron complex transport system substrate-binding protein
MRFIRLAFVAAVALACIGCHDSVYTKIGRNPKPVRRAVSLSPGATELALVYLNVDLVGRTASDDYPPKVKFLPVVMSGTKPNFEAISASGADTVFYDPALFSQSDLDKLKSHGLQMIPIGGDTIDDFIKTVYAAAAATGAETNTDPMVQNILRKLDNEKVSNSPKVAFVMPGQGSEHMIAGVNSFQGDILRRVGTVPVGPDSKHFVPMNVEQFVKDDPSIILTAGAPNEIASDPRLAGVSAVKSKHVYGISQDLALREGARVPDFIEAIGDALRLEAGRAAPIKQGKDKS